MCASFPLQTQGLVNFMSNILTEKNREHLLEANEMDSEDREAETTVNANKMMEGEEVFHLLIT